MEKNRLYKNLKSQLEKLVSDSESLRIEAANKQREYNQKLKAIDIMKYEISKLTNSSNIKISDHAIVRYFERVKGYNIKDLEKEILSEEVLKMIETLGGNGTYPHEGYSIIIKNYTVTTIIK